MRASLSLTKFIHLVLHFGVEIVRISVWAVIRGQNLVTRHNNTDRKEREYKIYNEASQSRE